MAMIKIGLDSRSSIKKDSQHFGLRKGLAKHAVDGMTHFRARNVAQAFST